MRQYFNFDSNKARDYCWELRKDPNVSCDVKYNMQRFINDVRKIAIDNMDELPFDITVFTINEKYENQIRKFFTYMGFEVKLIRFLNTVTTIAIKPL